SEIGRLQLTTSFQNSIHFLCVSVELCDSVVKSAQKNLTTETLRIHRDTENNLVHEHHEKLSRYFTPLPVLKRTTRSSAFTDPSSISLCSAGKQAAPSGAQKIPSAAPISFVASISSSSVTATAVPPEARKASMIRKSPIAFGTRRPDAVVCALGNSSAKRFPSSNAFTIGAQPAA